MKNGVVLLILAGITFSLVLGGNGIIGRAQYASNSWANATKDEVAILKQMEGTVENFTGGKQSSEFKLKVDSKDLSTVDNYKTVEALKE